MRKVYWTWSGIVDELVHESKLVNWMNAVNDCKVVLDNVESVGSDRNWTIEKYILIFQS